MPKNWPIGEAKICNVTYLIVPFHLRVNFYAGILFVGSGPAFCLSFCSTNQLFNSLNGHLTNSEMKLNVIWSYTHFTEIAIHRIENRSMAITIHQMTIPQITTTSCTKRKMPRVI